MRPRKIPPSAPLEKGDFGLGGMPVPTGYYWLRIRGMKPYTRLSHSPEATRVLAARLGRRLAPGDVVALNGELGSGKTEFVHGLAAGLEVPPNLVASPSFTLVHEYPGRVTLVHLDLYRLEDLPPSLLPDLEEYLAGDQVVAVEWARRLAPLLPGDYLEVDLTITGESERSLTFTGHGPRSWDLVRHLAGVA